MKTDLTSRMPGLLLVSITHGFCQPVITTQPTDQSVSIGATATFAISATGVAPLLYQWRFNTNDIPRATSASLSLSNAQTALAGPYDVVVSNLSGSVTSRLAHLEVDPAFTKIVSGSIVTDIGTGTACAWGDYDNDGFIDLIVTSAFNALTGLPEKNALYRNNRDGTFTKITNTVVTAEARDWRGCSWVDYDNDGNLDLFVTSTDANGFVSQNELFRNNGNGTFTKMTGTTAGAIVPGGGGSEGPVWADYDGDGFVDVYVVRYGPDWLFKNNGDGTFQQVTNSGIPPDNRNSYRAAWCDYDGGGWPDLFVSSGPYGQLGSLYRGLGDGTFTNVMITNGMNSVYSSSAAWGDYDNDGYPDVFISRFNGLPSLLYHNNRDGTLQKMTSSVVGSIASDIASTYDCAWGDYDNDGFLDLFIAAGDPGGNPTGHNLLYHNNGDGTFTRVLTGSIVNDPVVGCPGCAWGDYDNDGFLDLFVVDGSDATPRTNLLYRNNANSNAWIKIKLVGTASNRSAIGSKVRVYATIRGTPMQQLREINTGSGFSGSAQEAHFGLGDATNVDLVRIEWPSGIIQTLTNVSPRHTLTVVEHQERGIPPPAPDFTNTVPSGNGSVRLSVAGEPALVYVLEASTDLVNWMKIGVQINVTGTVTFTDNHATNFLARLYRAVIP